MASIGFIGVGNMGGPMCRNIIAGGHPVVVCDKNPEAVERCTALGAQAGATPKEVAGRVEVVMTSLPLPPNLEEVALGPDGIAAGAAKGLVHIDLSTNSPSFVRKIGAAMEDAGRLLTEEGGSDVVIRNDPNNLDQIVAVRENITPETSC